MYGAHQFILHPAFVAAAWTKLYGFPFDPRLWVCFIVHDWGYWGCGNLDGLAGKMHPRVGARIAGIFGQEWHDMCLLHSRDMARMENKPPSKLCAADKLACAMTWDWIYLPSVKATGEVKEYLADWEDYSGKRLSPKQWRIAIKKHMTSEAMRLAQT